MFNRSKTFVLSLSLGLLILSSCGVKSTTADEKKGTSALLVPDSYACEQSEEGKKLKLEIEQLLSRMAIVFPAGDNSSEQRASYGLQSPLIINDELTQNQLTQLKEEFDLFIKAKMIPPSNYGYIFLTDEREISQWNKYKSKVARLKLGHLRWMDRRCALEQIPDDEGWSVLMSKGYQMTLSDHIRQADLVTEDILSLCQNFHPLPVCKMEQKISLRNNDYFKVVQKYSSLIDKDKERSFFARDKKVKWKCSLEKEIKTLTLPVRVNREELFKWGALKELVFTNVSLLWKSANFQIKLVPEENLESQSFDLSQTIFITPTDKAISHVKNRLPRTMFINTQLAGEDLEKVLAHELGHVLGFPDCYLEYFDRKLKQLVYFEVGETTDLMCSLQGKVQARAAALEELSQACLTTY